MSVENEPLELKITKLGARIKNTSTVRFASSKRIRFNHTMANVTVVCLSLWSIFISFALTSTLSERIAHNRETLEVVGVILPVFIVVFSLIESGENLVRAHLLELNARQLRELGDNLFSAHVRAKNKEKEKNESDLVDVFEKFSKEYNDVLERSPVNHDDIDHLGKHYLAERARYIKDFKKSTKVNDKPSISKFDFLMKNIFFRIIIFAIWIRRQFIRVTYISLWFIPIVFFLV